MKTIQQKIRSRILAFGSLIVLTMTINAICLQSALGQVQKITPTAAVPVNPELWTTDQAGGIYNTNVGNVGVGTSTPSYKLDVSGLINTTGGFCIAGVCKTKWSDIGGGSSQWSNAAPHIFFNTGNVGIGTSTPGNLLEINKSQNAGTALIVDNAFTGSSNSAYSGIFFKQAAANRFFLGSINDGNGTNFGGAGAVQLWNFASGPTIFATSDVERMRITAAGNFGIGTTSVNERFVNTGNSLFGGATNKTELWSGFSSVINAALVEINSGVPVSNDTRFAALTMGSHQSGTSNVIGAIYFANSSLGAAEKRIAGMGSYTDGATNSGSLLFSTANAGVIAERMRIDKAGNVGIGKPVPMSKLDVNGTVNASAFTINGAAFTGSQWSTTGSKVFYNGGNIGVGTGDPATKLDVIGQIHTGGVCGGGVPNVQGGYFSWNQINCSTGEVDFINHQGGGTGGFWFANTSNGSTLSPLMRITGDGNVGIGTNTPTAKLDVAGNINVTGTGNINASGTITGGNIVAKYQDVAEWVESSQSLAPGTVVVLDQARSNQVIASSEVYDTRVAGVISAQPGITLGESGKSKVLVATTGRVMVNVDATSGPIRIGDLLVTSEKSGVAMKSQSISVGGAQIHRPGTLLGKALESLESGTGRILVLLSLQ